MGATWGQSRRRSKLSVQSEMACGLCRGEEAEADPRDAQAGEPGAGRYRGRGCFSVESQAPCRDSPDYRINEYHKDRTAGTPWTGGRSENDQEAMVANLRCEWSRHLGRGPRE